MVNPKQLLVEGVDDLHAVIGLMKHHVEWPNDKHKAPIWIEAVGSVTEILDRTFLSTKLKESGLNTLGILIDADDEPAGRWTSFCTLCSHIAPPFPKRLPRNGFIVECESGLRLGFWLMPDCISKGMMETFLRYLVPDALEPVWSHAISSFSQAKRLGATCRTPHADKAHVHTWLAWQDPPGERLGIALTKKILDPQSPSAQDFVNWIIELYRLKALSATYRTDDS